MQCGARAQLRSWFATGCHRSILEVDPEANISASQSNGSYNGCTILDVYIYNNEVIVRWAKCIAPELRNTAVLLHSHVNDEEFMHNITRLLLTVHLRIPLSNRVVVATDR
uniref:Uncharacterized protein n=1 Tax=Ascaris lumbricoides TaxID=6252 RepID=A0A0M3HP28_ASCLU